MEIHQLRYFCAVAKMGSFTRAARNQHVSQPSLSQQILKLEDELGAKLFDRFDHTVKLSRMGELFLPEAQAVLTKLENVKAEIKGLWREKLAQRASLRSFLSRTPTA